MKTNILSRARAISFQRGYSLTEALVYVGVLFILGGVGYGALYRCIDNSVALRRSVDDITKTLHAGEQWRADIRAATAGFHVQHKDAGDELTFASAGSAVGYRVSTNTVYRRRGAGGWAPVLANVRSSAMLEEQRDGTTVWRWELELEPRRKAGASEGVRLRPLFTFLGVPPNHPSQ